MGQDITLNAATPDRCEWDTLMSQHRAAKLAGAEYDRSHVNPLYAAMKAAFGDFAIPLDDPRRDEWRTAHNHDAIIAQNEHYADLESNARRTLLRMPSPDLAALRWKLDETFADDDISLWCDEIANAIRADIARLMPKGA
ncbi:MAG: hypothetical protein ABW184_09890 [Sphingobium sp.]